MLATGANERLQRRFSLALMRNASQRFTPAAWIAEVRWSGLGKYIASLIIVFLASSWIFRDGVASLAAEDYAILTLIVISVATLMGIGPAAVTPAGLLTVIYAIVDVQIRGGSGEDGLAFLLVMVAANGEAVKSTFWRARTERQGAYVNRLTEQLKLLTDGSVNYALYMTDVEGRVVHWNRGAQRFTGWDSRDIMNRPVSLLYSQLPGMGDNMAEAFALAKEHGSCEFDCYFIRNDRSAFMQNCVVTALRDGKGRLQGFAKLVRDVTAERAQEVALQEREAELRSILETAPDAVFVVDISGRIDYMNSTACRMFGYGLRELEGGEFDLLLTGAQPPREVREEPLHVESDTPLSYPRRLIGRRRNGSNFPIEMSFVKMEGAHETHYTAFIRDLTEQEATKARLELLQTEMLHGTRYSAMGAMASMLAHELNQPLTALAAYMEGSSILLMRGQEADRSKLNRIFRSAAQEAVRAGAIMRRLRDFASDGEALLEIHDAQDVVRSSLALIAAMAEAADITVEMEVAPDAGSIFADPIQIQQVIGNLCRNAIEAMRDEPERRLTVRVAAADDLATHFFVSDTGSGIPAVIKDRIFDAFVSSKEEGTGVGLSICRTIVEAHGGRIWLEPSATGSCFGFSLRRKKGNAIGSH